ncbi:DUF167 domain-containing protein [Palleronia caenipelagi]|uniref:DUF167 domain-containing protein n=1 Tax=Palleronia caenipelagi TaxID=2489174 RepID=UPI001FE3A1CB|nr:DUF167 domain-containing protein [Palleronia caenipelagi]
MEQLRDLVRVGHILELKVTPGARQPEIRREGDVIRVKVTAPPDKGKANAAVIVALAKALGLPKSRLELVSGAASRSKRVKVLPE